MIDEVKRIVDALRTCHSNEDCRDCKYIESDKDEMSCVNMLFVDTARIIQSLSAENERLNAAIAVTGAIECERDMIKHELEQVKRERDAAVNDITESAPCFACKHFARNGGSCRGGRKCLWEIVEREGYGENHTGLEWEWRGVQED